MSEQKTLAIIASENGITANQTLLESFQEFFKQAEEWNQKGKALVVTSLEQTQLMADAREARLALKKIRVAIENKRKELKEESLRTGQTIDSMAKILTNLIIPTEKHLEEQEKFAEREQERLKQEKTEARLKILAEHEMDGAFYDLGNMPDDIFEKLLETAKLAQQKKKEEAELAAKKAEEERLAGLERERIAKVKNDRLEALVKLGLKYTGENLGEMEHVEFENWVVAEKARLLQEEEKMKAIESRKNDCSSIGLKWSVDRFAYADLCITLQEITDDSNEVFNQKVEAIREELLQRESVRLAEEEKTKKEAEEREAALQKEKDAAQAKAKEEAEKAAALQKELDDKKAAEEAAERERLEAEEREKQKGDDEKFTSLINELDGLKKKYQFISTKFIKLQDIVNSGIDDILEEVEAQESISK